MAKKSMTVIRKLGDNHKGHSNHLCELTAHREMAMVAEKSKGAKFVCYICGRAAASSESLCEPVEI